jgi:PPOX class probable F420-dependent enzyme
VTGPVRLTPEQLVFVRERHLASLATLRPDGTPHLVPIAFTWDDERGEAWMTTLDGSVKVRNVEAALAAGRPARGAVCQVSGGRWLTLEGTLVVDRDPAVVAEAERRFAVRHTALEPEPRRVVLRLRVDRVLGSEYMTR